MTSAPDPLPHQVSETFDPRLWREVPATEHGGEAFTDITYHRAVDRIESPDGGRTGHDLPTVRIAFDRPEVRNAFRPHTVDELYRALDHARLDTGVGVILLTGNGPSPKDGGHSFCSGGDQRIRGRAGYEYSEQRGPRRDHPGAHRLQRPPAHPRGAAPDPHHGQGRDRRGERLGRRRRSLPARGRGPLDRLARACAVQADRRERGLLRRRLRLGLSRQAGRPEAGPGDLLPRRGVLGAGCRRLGRGEPRRGPRGSRDRGARRWPARSPPSRRRRSAC